MDREHYASLEQFAPGDRIWLDGAWRRIGWTTEHDGEIDVGIWGWDGQSFTAPAALLVRRAET
jgi:hypothetical protein